MQMDSKRKKPTNDERLKRGLNRMSCYAFGQSNSNDRENII